MMLTVSTGFAIFLIVGAEEEPGNSQDHPSWPAWLFSRIVSGSGLSESEVEELGLGGGNKGDGSCREGVSGQCRGEGCPGAFLLRRVGGRGVGKGHELLLSTRPVWARQLLLECVVVCCLCSLSSVSWSFLGSSCALCT